MVISAIEQSIEQSTEQYSLFTTADGSPTLSFKDTTGYAEKMHHSAGAFSESLYIYHQAFCERLQLGGTIDIASVGLGLGYNELIIAAECVRRQTPANDVKLHSYETDPQLRQEFCHWIQGTPTSRQSLAHIHTQILDLVATHFLLPAATIRHWLKQAYDLQHFIIFDHFPLSVPADAKYSLIFYDAFSAKMSPEMWSEVQLQSWIKEHTATTCVVATYAATGNLRRTLKQNHFVVKNKKGFQGKRDSTLAVRLNKHA